MQSRAIDNVLDDFTMVFIPDKNIDPGSPKAEGGPKSTIDISESVRSFPQVVVMIFNGAVHVVDDVSVVTHGKCPTMTRNAQGGDFVSWKRSEIDVLNGICKYRTSLG